jgi:drug/metabolite transporter (DMT)-like permease
MSWVLIAIISYLLLATSNLGDKFLIENVLSSSRVYAFLASIMGGLVVLAAPWFLHWPGFYFFAFNIFVGLLFPLCLFFMFKALKEGDTSKVDVLIGGIIPIFTIIGSFVFFGERFFLHQWLGIFSLILGTIFLALVSGQGGYQALLRSKRAFYLSLVSAIFFAVFFLGTKFAYNHQDFASAFIWIRMGAVLGALIMITDKHARQEIFAGLYLKKSESSAKSPKRKKRNKVLIFGNQALGAVGFILQNYAISFGSVAVVNALQGVQYAFLLIIGWLLTIFHPHIIKEDISDKIILRKVLAIALISIGLYFVVLK